jgi:tetratricopeptide (TPR) repeat protein
MDYHTSICATCGTTAPKLKNCPCGFAHYCGSKCQEKHWKTHRENCADYLAIQVQNAKTTHGKDSVHFTNALFELGENFNRNQQGVKAEKILIKCQASFNRVRRDHPQLPKIMMVDAAILMELGESHRIQGAFQLASTTFAAAMVLVQQLPESVGREKFRQLLIKRTTFVHSALNIEYAVPAMQKLIQECDNENDKAVFSGNLCVAYTQCGEYELALDIGHKTLSTARHLNNQELVGDMLNAIGIALLCTGNIDESLRYAEEALPLQRSTKGNKSFDVVQSMNLLGGIFLCQGKLDDAIKLYKKALRKIRHLTHEQHHPIMVGVVESLIHIYLSQAKYTEALALIEKEEPLARRALLDEYDIKLAEIRRGCAIEAQ